jgi:hypothetical protein
MKEAKKILTIIKLTNKQIKLKQLGTTSKWRIINIRY